jgi:DNA-binding MarR family transcriptional regulator
MEIGQSCLKGSLGYLLNSAQSTVQRALLHAIKEAGYDITVEQWTVLVHLWEQDGVSQQELSMATGKDNASICRLIDSLEKRNLVVRIPNKTDRRINDIYTTNNAKSIRPDLVRIAEETFASILKNVSEQDRQTFYNVLRIVSE